MIKIINVDDYTKNAKVILDLNTNQPFEVVVKGLGRAVGLDEASHLMTRSGRVATSFRELETVCSTEDLLYVSSKNPIKGHRIKRHLSEPEVKMRSYQTKRTSTASPKIYEGKSKPGLNNSITLDWIYGCNFSCSNMLFVTNRERIVYIVSQVVVIYDMFDETQKHYLGHTSTIQCLDISEDESLAVSGQKAKRLKGPEIQIWSPATLENYQESFVILL